MPRWERTIGYLFGSVVAAVIVLLLLSLIFHSIQVVVMNNFPLQLIGAFGLMFAIFFVSGILRNTRR